MAIDGSLKLNVQLLRGGSAAIGPGKALVLRAIAAEGSIAAAGRALGMSYRRIWLLVDALNGDWQEPVVATRQGGGRERGAALTPFGTALLARYEALEATALAAVRGEALNWLNAAMRPPA